jgi:hypothetical protein
VIGIPFKPGHDPRRARCTIQAITDAMGEIEAMKKFDTLVLDQRGYSARSLRTRMMQAGMTKNTHRTVSGGGKLFVIKVAE